MTPTDPEPDPVVAFMASDAGMVARLLAEHRSDRSGRCRVCGDQARGARPEWPCALHSYAAQAWNRLLTSENKAYARGARSQRSR